MLASQRRTEVDAEGKDLQQIVEERLVGSVHLRQETWRLAKRVTFVPPLSTMSLISG